MSFGKLDSVNFRPLLSFKHLPLKSVISASEMMSVFSVSIYFISTEVLSNGAS